MVILRALKLGDFLTGIPALRAIDQAFPGYDRVLAAPAGFAALVRHTRVASRLVAVDGLGRPLPPELGHPAVAIDLHGRGPGSQPRLIELNPDRLVAFFHPDIPATHGQPRWQAGEPEIARWCRLLSESGIPADPDDLHIAAPRVSSLPSWLPGATVIHPGAASEARRWPVERFAAVARAEIAEGREVAITGSANEAALAHQLAALAGLAANRVLAGQWDLLGLTDVIAGAGRVVVGDTGVAHLATALGVPSVVLFGPVSPAEWGPPAGRRQHRALWHGSLGDPHGHRVDPGLLRIPVNEVLSALADLSDLTAVAGGSTTRSERHGAP